MICPTCHAVMIVVEQDKIELDYCTNCSGVWFDSGELELMLERMELDSSTLPLAKITDLPEARSTEKKRRCPICGRKMRKTNIGQEPKVLIDVCPKGDGLWFDGGEIRQIIEQCAVKSGTEPDSEDRVLAFLGDTFKAERQPGSQ
jgi:Zn-finger nucleic acid-binding protein